MLFGNYWFFFIKFMGSNQNVSDYVIPCNGILTSLHNPPTNTIISRLRVETTQKARDCFLLSAAFRTKWFYHPWNQTPTLTSDIFSNLAKKFREIEGNYSDMNFQTCIVYLENISLRQIRITRKMFHPTLQWHPLEAGFETCLSFDTSVFHTSGTNWKNIIIYKQQKWAFLFLGVLSNFLF